MKYVYVIIMVIVFGLLPIDALAVDWWSETPDLKAVDTGMAEALTPAVMVPWAPAELWNETLRLTGMNYGEPLDAAATVHIKQHVVPEMYAETLGLTAVAKAKPAQSAYDLITVAK